MRNIVLLPIFAMIMQLTVHHRFCNMEMLTSWRNMTVSSYRVWIVYWLGVIQAHRT